MDNDQLISHTPCPRSLPSVTLVKEDAWAWIRQDPAAEETFRRLLRNTGEPNKAIAAMARRLALHLWKMLRDEQILAEGIERFAMRLCGYCLMSNHWHLLLWSPKWT